TADAVCDGFRDVVHDWLRYRGGAGEPRGRSCLARYLLCHRSLPLRSVAGRSVRYFRWLLLLVSENVGLSLQRNPCDVAVLADVCRREPDLLPAAFSRHGRHAAPLR